jgi:hypothetical protein
MSVTCPNCGAGFSLYVLPGSTTFCPEMSQPGSCRAASGACTANCACLGTRSPCGLKPPPEEV